MKTFEIFIQKDKISFSDWQKLEEKVFEYEKRFAVELVFETNSIGFYLYSQKDLSLLSEKLEDFLLKPTNYFPSDERRVSKKISFRLALDKNILEIKEKEQIRNNRIIEKMRVEFYKLLSLKFYQLTVFVVDKNKQVFSSSYFTLNNPLITCEFDFKKKIRLKKKSPPVFLKIDNLETLFTSSKNLGFLEVFGFPYFSYPQYFPLKSFEFNKHSLLVGQTGVGKSKLLELFVKEIVRCQLTDEYRVIIIDPHAALYQQFLTLPSKINFDFIHSSCDLFPAFSEPKIATELIILLFKTVLKDQFNAKMERVLKYVVYVLFLKNQMSLLNLRRFLTELEMRKEILALLPEEYGYLSHFFDTEFVELQTKFYEIAIMPILVLIDELSFIPAFLRSTPHKLELIIKNHFLTCFSLNRIFLGDKATRLIAGLIIQQIFLIAQKREVNKKIILLIDEVSLVENESLISILSEARKFELSLFLSQQYLTQISNDLLKAILSNVYNYFVFKVGDEDAKILAKNLEVKFPEEVLKKEKEKGLFEVDLNLTRELLVTLNPRECLVRIFSQGKFYPCFKARTLSI